MKSDTVRLYEAQLDELAALKAKAQPDPLDDTRLCILRACIRGTEIQLCREAREDRVLT